MLERRSSAKVAKSVFYEDFNDIDIYIEDTAPGYRKIFKELLIQVSQVANLPILVHKS